jgi:hypothetical protein
MQRSGAYLPRTGSRNPARPQRAGRPVSWRWPPVPAGGPSRPAPSRDEHRAVGCRTRSVAAGPHSTDPASSMVSGVSLRLSDVAATEPASPSAGSLPGRQPPPPRPPPCPCLGDLRSRRRHSIRSVAVLNRNNCPWRVSVATDTDETPVERQLRLDLVDRGHAQASGVL